MMQNLLNAARREAERVVARLALPKTGIVSGYDPANYAAKVRLQPQDVETGWLPVRTPWAGNGWGLFCPPDVGDEVEVQFQEGGKKAPYVALRAFGDRFRPLGVPAGEFWLVHKAGSFLKFRNDGSVEVNAAGNLTATVAGQATLTVAGKVVASAQEFDLTGNVRVTGDVLATGDVYDLNGTHGTFGALRAAYDAHRHAESRGGTTSAPDLTV